MSRFQADLNAAFLGTLSTESSIIDEPEVTEPSNEISDEVIEEVREEREALADALDDVDEIGDDRKDIEVSVAVAESVAAVVEGADTMPVPATDAFVAMANCTIAEAEKVLDTDIPKLDTDATGAVSQASMESIGGWFASAAKAFGAAMGSFGARVMLGISRLNESSNGLMKRSMRVRSLMAKREGNGGKPLKLSSGVSRHLVLKDGYATNLPQGLIEFAITNVALTREVEVYHGRLAEMIKMRIFDAINRKADFSALINIPTEDLLKKITEILGKQPAMFIGNQRYDFQENRYNKILTAILTSTDPDAKELVRHLDAPLSLSNEQIAEVLKCVEDTISEQLKTLERITTSTKNSFSAVKSVVEKLNAVPADEDEDGVELHDTIDRVELLRIENQMVSELGRVVDRLVDYQRDLIDRIDSVLTLVEESVFQD